MRYTFIFLALMMLQLTSYSQKKKLRAMPPPPPKESIYDSFPDTLSLQEYGLPKLFEWKMNSNVTLKPGTDFKELIRLTYGTTEVNRFYSEEPLTLKKVKAGSLTPEAKIPKMIRRLLYYDVNIANGIITFKERGQLVMALKIFYGKNKQVIYLKNIENGAVYLPVQSDEMPVVTSQSVTP